MEEEDKSRPNAKICSRAFITFFMEEMEAMAAVPYLHRTDPHEIFLYFYDCMDAAYGVVPGEEAGSILLMAYESRAHLSLNMVRPDESQYDQKYNRDHYGSKDCQWGFGSPDMHVYLGTLQDHDDEGMEREEPEGADQ